MGTIVATAINAAGSIQGSVEVRGAPRVALFHIDWSTALGTGDVAVRDTDKATPWDTGETGGDLEVVTAAGEGLTNWPTPNALRVNFSGSSSFLKLLGASQIITIPAIGESRSYRWYHQNCVPDGSSYFDRQHVVEQNNGGWSRSNGNWVWRTEYINGYADGKWIPQWAVQSGLAPGGWANAAWEPTSQLDKHTTYCHEVQQERVGADTYKIHMRISDGSGLLLFSDSSIRNNKNSARLDSEPVFTYRDIKESYELQVGLNGFPSVDPFTWGYYGAVAVGKGGWLGPYSGGI